jgi:uncharacterized protein YlaI
MKRLCIFYKHADRWIGKPIEWIVCKECQRKIQRGDERLKAGIIWLISHVSIKKTRVA